MNKAHQKSLQTKLDTKIIALIAPKGMSYDEYQIACNLENINPTVRNGSFLHWVMTAKDGDDTNVEDKVHKLIIRAIEKKYLLDPDDEEQCSYFIDAICDMIPRDKFYVIKLIEAVFKGYPGTSVFDCCRRLNKAFGFTPKFYFSSEHESIVDSVKESLNDARNCRSQVEIKT